LETSYKPPQNDIERGLVDLWKDLLGIDKIGTEDNFFELGGHSLIAVRLFVRIKKMYAVDFSLATLFDAPTIAQLAKLLQAKLGDTDGQIQVLSPGVSSEWSPLVAIQPKGNKPPFFCVHGIHGNVLIFYHLTRHLGQQQPFYALQAYGVDGKHPAIESLPEMAAKYIKAMKTVQPEGPYYLGGFSMGGEIAFEMAQQLHQQGDQVAILVLFDTYEPGYVRRRSRTGTKIVSRQPVTDSNTKSRNRLFHFAQRSNQAKMASLKGWADAQRKQFYATLGFLLLKAGQPMPQKVIELYLEKRHRQALLNYHPQPYPGRITLFRANITLPLKSVDPSLSWVALAKQGVDLHLLHAPHEIIEEPYVQVLVQKLSTCLEQARQQ
jgi:thioesterase domain-containing protein/acyl carrier protein